MSGCAKASHLSCSANVGIKRPVTLSTLGTATHFQPCPLWGEKKKFNKGRKWKVKKRCVPIWLLVGILDEHPTSALEPRARIYLLVFFSYFLRFSVSADPLQTLPTHPHPHQPSRHLTPSASSLYSISSSCGFRGIKAVKEFNFDGSL